MKYAYWLTNSSSEMARRLIAGESATIRSTPTSLRASPDEAIRRASYANEGERYLIVQWVVGDLDAKGLHELHGPEIVGMHPPEKGAP